MLCEHTTEEQQLWTQIKQSLLSKINASNSTSDIELPDEVDGQLTLRSKRPVLREVVLSFSSPNPYMNVHCQADDRPSGLSLMLRVEGNQLINAASDQALTVDDLVANVLTYLLKGE